MWVHFVIVYIACVFTVSRVKSGNSTRPGTAISARASAVSVDADPASDAISGEFSLATTSNFNTRGTAAMLTTIANTGVGGIISGVDMHVLQQRIEALELEKQILYGVWWKRFQFYYVNNHNQHTRELNIIYITHGFYFSELAAPFDKHRVLFWWL